MSEVGRAFSTARVLAPEGGITLKRGHTWFLNERAGVDSPQSLPEATARVLPSFDSRETISGQAWLCGFDNSGVFAASLLLAHPGQFLGGGS
jgi:hypothetical protein